MKKKKGTNKILNGLIIGITVVIAGICAVLVLFSYRHVAVLKVNGAGTACISDESGNTKERGEGLTVWQGQTVTVNFSEGENLYISSVTLKTENGKTSLDEEELAKVNEAMSYSAAAYGDTEIEVSFSPQLVFSNDFIKASAQRNIPGAVWLGGTQNPEFSFTKLTVQKNTDISIPLNGAFDGEALLHSSGVYDKSKIVCNESALRTDCLGSYPVTYGIGDNIIAEITVEVCDVNPPELEVHDVWGYVGATFGASDLVTSVSDETETNVYFKDNYDFAEAGSYAVTIVAEDSSGNKTEKEAMVVIERDDIAPTMDGLDTIYAYVGGSADFYTGVGVYDNLDPAPTYTCDAGAVNFNAAGTYTAVYVAADSDGNTATYYRSVVVSMSDEQVRNQMAGMAQGYSSPTGYLILIDCSHHKVGVFTGSSGAWSLLYYWDCGNGAQGTETVKGTFSVSDRGSYFITEDNYICYYWTRFYGDYLFHSIKYDHSGNPEPGQQLGVYISHGCIRLAMENAIFIYNNVPSGTTVVSY